MNADFILTNGDILTLNQNDEQHSAVAIKDGKIAWMGSQEEAHSYQSKNTELFDLKGRTVLPGFIESHTHPFSFGMSLMEFDCSARAVDSIKELKEKLGEYHKTHTDKQWITGRGWDDSKLAEKRLPTRWDLDEVVPDRPVMLSRTCGHVSVLNSKALETVGITKETPDPEGGKIVRDENSLEPNGRLEERAMELVPRTEYTLTEAEKGMQLAQKEFANWGFTTVHEAGVWSDIQFKVYQHMYNTNQLDVRYRLWFWALNETAKKGYLDSLIDIGIESGFGNDLLQVAGSKFMLDGSVGGRTAALAEPYENSTSRGILHFDDLTQVKNGFQRSLENGLRIKVHGIGERAIEVALECFEEVAEHMDINPMRNRIEHAVLPTKDHLQRMKNLNLIAASSVGFIYNIGDSYYENLGPERVKRAFPHRSFKEYGLAAPGNSDLPVTNGNPLEGIYGIVNRKSMGGKDFGDSEKLSMKEALYAYTREAAYSSFEEDTLGQISPGLPADIVVLEENPLNIDPEHVKDLQVDLTVMNGRITYQRD